MRFCIVSEYALDNFSENEAFSSVNVLVTWTYEYGTLSTWKNMLIFSWFSTESLSRHLFPWRILDTSLEQLEFIWFIVQMVGFSSTILVIPHMNHSFVGKNLLSSMDEIHIWHKDFWSLICISPRKFFPVPGRRTTNEAYSSSEQKY